MKGELSIEARPGPGTTFRVRLPIVAPRPRDEAPRPPVQATPRRARLLVVDDEPMIGAMISRVLGGAHEVESTTSPDAALARVAAGERFDLILCDLMMPGRSGVDVHAAIASVAPEQAKRMVFLTGGALTAGAADFLARHGSRVVSKPFSVDELCHKVAGALAELER
jgi:CheY-like chemotaxis protein